MIALKNEFGDYIYFDVVTRYSKTYPSQISQHPVDGSGVVSDNVTKQNPKIQLQGMISGADFNSSKPNLTSEDRAFIGINQIVVESDVADQVVVKYENTPYNLLPDVAGQFFTDELPKVQNISEGRNATYTEKVLFSVLETYYEFKDKLTLYEFEGDSIVEELSDLFITNLNVEESATTGDAFVFNITLEQVSLSYLIETEVPEDVREDFSNKDQEEVNQGGQSSSIISGGRLEDLSSNLRSIGDLVSGN